MGEKHYTWEEKIESLVKLAKAAGRYVNSREGTDYNEEAMFNLREAYDEFCQWRHDEPYVVDEIKALLGRKEYTDELTGVKLVVEKDNPDYPGYPKLTIVCPKQVSSIDVINDAVARLQDVAAIAPQHRIPPIKIERR
jgi:hypothetical protein